MPYARCDGLSLYYEQQGSDPPLLFVHGWCCDHTFFQPQVDHFRSTHSVTVLDLRGCGSSDRCEDGYDIPTLTDDISWLCQEIGLRRPVLYLTRKYQLKALELAFSTAGLSVESKAHTHSKKFDKTRRFGMALMLLSNSDAGNGPDSSAQDVFRRTRG